MPSAPQLDEGTLTDGDMGFTGLNELTQPSQLQTGEVAAALNARFTNNKAEPRLGLAKLPWTNRVTTASTTPLPFTTIYGGLDFRDPDDVEWSIIAADGKVYRTRESNGATEITLPPGVVINYLVTFTQCFSGLVMFRGEDLDPLVMETIDGGFQPIAQTANTISGTDTENPTDGTEAIPPANNGDWIGNRLFIPYNKDWLAISDYLNPTRYAGVRAQARINQGSEDALVRFFKFSDNAGIAFKSSSIYVLNNITSDLSTMTLDEVTSEYGLAAAKSCVNTGSDVWFLAEKRGICSIFQTELNKLQGKDVPVSLHVKQLIGRINWRYASGAVAAYYDNKYYLAVPLDEATCAGPELMRNQVYGSQGGESNLFAVQVVVGATYRWTKGPNDTSLPNGDEVLTESGDFTAQTAIIILQGAAGAPVTAGLRRLRTGVNNAVLVYDFLQQKWAGADTGGAVCVQEWIKATYQGVRRLFALSADGFINLYEELLYDEVGYETFAANISGGGEYDAAASKSVSVTPGAFYNYALGENELSLRNGTEEHAAREGAFTAAGGVVILIGTAPSTALTARIWPINYMIEPEWIGFDVTLRGFTCQSPAWKRFIRTVLQLETWYPEFSIYAITEGAHEQVAVVTDRTKNFLTYDRPFDRAAWDRTNVNNDHATPYRQDYAVVLGDDTTASGSIEEGVTYFVEDLTGAASINYNGNVVTAPDTFVGVAGVATFAVVSGTPLVYAPGNYFIPGSAGADPDLTQESAEPLRFPLSCEGKQVQLRIVSTRGRVAVLSAGVEARLTKKHMGSHV